jgi:3-phosphoshikimate 1-carboxyvinyltransferase
MHKNSISVKIPASKSISNRLLVLGAFAGEGKIIRNILKSEDTEVMFNAYDELKVEYEILSEDEESIDIKILKTASAENAKFYMNNSGTSTRFLIPCLGLIKGTFVLDGVERMRERPIKDLVDALEMLGLEIEYLGATGFLPLKTSSTGNLAGTAKIKCDLSSQYLSGLLIAKSIANSSFKIGIEGDTVVSKPYIDLTNQVIDIFAKQQELFVETDFSSASYFVAMGILGEKSIFIENINPESLQADRKLVSVLTELGADLQYIDGGLLCRPSELLFAAEIDCNEFPDSAMTLAIICSLNEGGTTKLTGLSTLKHKECDRLVALRTELGKVGVQAEIDEDSITIEGVGPREIKAAQIETYNDHRMAMCFSIYQLFNRQVEILNPECVNKTFPTYFKKSKLITG